MSIHELSEQIEHVAHHAHEPAHKGSAKSIGITMAMLGVMLAFSAAMVGSQRTELVKTMVLQASKWGLYQAETTKFRVIEADLELLKSLTPTKAEVARMQATLREKRRASGKADDEDTAEIKELIASATEDMAELVTPDAKEVGRFKKMTQAYARDVKEAKEDAEAYDAAIEVHQRAAEWYEWAQLAAEVGIVVASIALLLTSQLVWIVSVCLGVVCAGMLGFTTFSTRAAAIVAEQKIHFAAENIQKIEADDESPDDSSPAKADAKESPQEQK
jgi:hypothetical protein